MSFSNLRIWLGVGRVPPIDIHMPTSGSYSDLSQSSYTDESSYSGSPPMDPMPIHEMMGLGLNDKDDDKSDEGSETDEKTKLPIYSLREISYHDSYEDCWLVIFDKVYDVTRFLYEHPGGEDIMMESAGRDATIAFSGVGSHSRAAIKSLDQYLVGILPVEERLYPTEQEDNWHHLM